jgi:hypothetical protein
MAIEKSTAFPGRECGSCSLCCKLIAIVELTKSAGKWCPHCAPGKGGCLIYQDRPPSCRDFHCGWLQSDLLGPEWKPTKSRMVISRDDDVDRLTIYVDPDFPTAWRKEPYYSQILNMAQNLAGEAQLLIRINNRVIVLLPDKEVDLGIVEEDDHVLTWRSKTTGDWQAIKILAKDVPSHQKGNLE